MAETRLREALDLLRERGWTKSTFEDELGRLCSLGAIATAWTGSSRSLTGDSRGDERALEHVMNEQFPTGPRRYVTELNDMVGVGWPDVERCFEKAAAIIEEQV